jgi:hypothetical protein
MPVNVPVTIKSSPLPSNFKGTPQQFQDALTARLYLETSLNSISLVAQGSVAPSSNQGPWLKDGTTWYIWSDATGSYVPVSADFLTLRYVASPLTAIPDPAKYTLWIQLDAAGQAIGIAYWFNSAWRNVYDTTFLAYNEQILNASTLYPFRGDGAANVDVVFTTTGTEIKEVPFSLVETFDPNNVFGSSTFTAPTGGYFHFDAKIAFECVTGTPTDNSVIFGLKKGIVPLHDDLTIAPIDNALLGIRNYSVSSLIALNPGDQISLFASITCTKQATWRVKAEGTSLSGNRVLSGL